MNEDWIDEDWLNDEHWLCLDCCVHTGVAREYYMVQKPVWQQAGAGRAMLCVGCLEARIGRVLTPDDFPVLPINSPGGFPHSERLRARMGV